MHRYNDAVGRNWSLRFFTVRLFASWETILRVSSPISLLSPLPSLWDRVADSHLDITGKGTLKEDKRNLKL